MIYFLALGFGVDNSFLMGVIWQLCGNYKGKSPWKMKHYIELHMSNIGLFEIIKFRATRFVHRSSWSPVSDINSSFVLNFLPQTNSNMTKGIATVCWCIINKFFPYKWAICNFLKMVLLLFSLSHDGLQRWFLERP